MRVRLASEPAPGRAVNEDQGFAVGGLVGVLDGVSVPDGVDTGCHHGAAWYVQRLSHHLVTGYRCEPDAPLGHLLAKAISAVREDHGGRCDLDNPGTVASTVCLLKNAGSYVDYLVLADSSLVLDRGDEIQVVTDDRFQNAVAQLDRLPLINQTTSGSVEEVARVRARMAEKHKLTNQPDGYWIAAANPAAAYEAVTGAAPLHGPDRVWRAALLTDGASAAVEQFKLFDWRGLLDLLTDHGPHELIRQVRVAENADYDGHARPRYKRHDDATAALCLFEEDQP
ncbi:hypothetical protein HC028_19855 [Planosporangium flavigriseum]|uniref:Protein phosphatase 2C n=2 Tax=Planosporangium flavigriseum TaxID=373681 RepID=A0A8J3LWL0_9ACTN|nr:hypothetical protein [Planosporangium flavigriseum]GIG74901.1 hypothetical protein Pfl04_33050 [Planosporangium flavigriseum]